jgi:two-component system sensor histidine kinase KdpD
MILRPDPDELLAQVQAEEQQQARGKLKIFLGYAAGVGKTYAMLEAAHQRKAEGIDVVVGYVETHGRAETEALLAGLETIPRLQVAYHGTTLPEIDLDAILARRPQLVLVDELAHTNVPGMRHPKRYLDVEELINAGIDVYTTVNIQHLESLNDVVAQVTGVIMRETVPDRILDEAREIELIDLPIDELLRRLEAGKVYIPAQAERAMRKFFRPGNLNALREMALRRAADRVDEQMRAYMQTHAIPGPWSAGERVLVCIGPSPLSERLVRTARRLARRLNAEWIAAYVETPGQATLSEADRNRIAQTLRLAEELGAQSVTLAGQHVAQTVVDYAHDHNVTKIVAGKPLRSRWTELWRGSIIDQIIRQSQDIDVYVISGESEPEATQTPRPATAPRQVNWNAYGYSILLVALVTALGLPLRPYIEPTNLVMFYLLAVIISALRLGRYPAVLASILSVLVFDVIFVLPYYTIDVAELEYLLTFAGFLVVGLVISTLAAEAREQERAAQRREKQTAALYQLSQKLSTASDLQQVAEAAVSQIQQTFGNEAALFIANDKHVSLLAGTPQFHIEADGYAVADWAYQRNQPAGRYTDTLTGVNGYYLPLRTTGGALGVLATYFPHATSSLSSEQRRLLESFASQTALALERAELAEKAGQARLLEETERLQTALLNSISHDLRTPLASITGALSSLHDDSALLDEEAKYDLVHTALEEARRLNRLVGNLLDMTRLESGAMKVELQPADIQDLVGAALAQMPNRLQGRAIEVSIPDDLPVVKMDFVLMVQVLVNLIDNALKYSPADQPIGIRAVQDNNQIVLEVADSGRGIPENELERIFDKFHRVRRIGNQNSGVGGTGLGLSISKGIVEAHNGRIWAVNQPEGGAAFRISLPQS